MKFRWLFFLSLISTATMIAVMTLQGAPLKIHNITPAGIIDFQLARTIQHATTIYKAWLPALVNTAIVNTYIDFIFILSYGSLLFLVCYKITKQSTGALKKIGRWLCYAMIVAPIFDVFENVLMLRTLSGHFSKEVIASTFFFSSVKFGLIACAVLFIAVSFVGRLFIRKHEKCISVV